MERYVSEYPNYKKKIAFFFKTSCCHCGGIGDYIKFLCFLIKIGIKYNIAVYCIDFGNESDQFLKLIYPKMYVKPENISNNMIGWEIEYKFKTEEEFNELQPEVYNVINPASLFSFDKNSGNIRNIHNALFPHNIILNDIFYFTNEVIENIPYYLKNTKYISIHIRLGCFTNLDNPNVSSFSEDKLDRFICQKKNSFSIFLCTDSLVLKKRLKDKHEHILITDFDIAHTGNILATRKSILNTITELLILANSEEIFTADDERVSGFPSVASRFKNINFMKLPTN